jgi:hypothetical protein
MANYNRFNVSILCVADSQDDVALYGAIKQALNAIPKVSVKVVNLDLWQDGGTGKTREFDENGNEIYADQNQNQIPVQVVQEEEETQNEDKSQQSEDIVIEDL